MVYSFVRAVTAVSAVIFLVTGEYNLATVYIVGRADVGEYGVAIVYSAVLIVFMVLVLIAIQVLVGERRIARRAETPAIADARSGDRCRYERQQHVASGGIPRRHQALWPRDRACTPSAFQHRARHAGDAAGPIRLRQDHHAAADRRAGAGERRTDPDRRRRCHAALGGRARRVNGVPVLCAVPAHDRAGKCLLRPAGWRECASAQARELAHGEARPWSDWPVTSARLPSELSGGQQQRVAVARAIVLEPKVLLFDEPLSNLDAKLRRRVREEIRALQQSLALTVVYVTHDQEEALAVSDRVIVMSMARIAQDGTPRSLYERPNSHFVADFIGDANLLPVTIEGYQGELASVRLGPLLLTLPHHGAIDGAPELSVRPQALLLAPQPANQCADRAGVQGCVSRQSHGVLGGGGWPEQRPVRDRPGSRGTIGPRRRGRGHTCPQWRRPGPATLNGSHALSLRPFIALTLTRRPQKMLSGSRSNGGTAQRKKAP